MKLARPEPVRRAVETPRCRLCNLPTAERKPFCIGHVDRLPFAASVIAERVRREAEDAGEVAFDPWSPRGDEIVAHVGANPSVARLAIELGTRKAAVVRYVRALVAAGRLRVVTECGPKGHVTSRVMLA